MKRVCMDANKVLQDGDGHVTHGICPECERLRYARLEELEKALHKKRDDHSIIDSRASLTHNVGDMGVPRGKQTGKVRKGMDEG